MSAKVQSVALNSANIRYNNAVNESRVYNIAANVNVHSNNVTSFDSGELHNGEELVCSFYQWDDRTTNYTYHKSFTSAEKYEIMLAIDEFVADVTEVVSTNTLSL